KFREQDLIGTPQEHALRLDITMDQFLLMEVVQGLGHLLDVGDNGIKWHPCTFRVVLAQCAIGGILHDQKGNTIFYTKIEDTHDMGMKKASQHECLTAKLLTALTCEVRMQHFDGCLRIEVQVFSQVNFSKATAP